MSKYLSLERAIFLGISSFSESPDCNPSFLLRRLDIELKDRFRIGMEPRKWPFLPLSMIEQAVECIKDGTISELRYHTGTANLVPKNNGR